MKSCSSEYFFALSLAIVLSISPGVFWARTQQTGAPGPASGSAAEQVFQQWLKMFNAGDAAAAREFVTAHYSEAALGGQSVEALAERALRLHEQVGGFAVVRVMKSSATEITVLLKERAGMNGYAEIHLELDAANPNHIAVIQLHPTQPPPDLAPKRAASTGEFAAQVSAYLDGLVAQNRFSGVVLIAKEGELLLSRSHGMANRETHEEITANTNFNLASLNKMFTGVAIAQLAEQGKLKYTDTVAQTLPDYPNHAVAVKITVHELLTHTSGLGDMFGNEEEPPKVAPKTLRDYVSLFASVPLRFEPGSSWAYSNAGYIVLGLIIERLSGESYYEYIRDHILTLAGMKDTGCYEKTGTVANRAVGYTHSGPSGPLPDGQTQPNDDLLPWRGTSAGGCYSTAPDLMKFADALRSHKLLSVQATETLWTGKVKTPRPNDQYAYGFSDQIVGGQHVVGHNGGTDGASTRMDIYLGSGYTVIVLSNLDPPIAEMVGDAIRERMPN